MSTRGLGADVAKLGAVNFLEGILSRSVLAYADALLGAFAKPELRVSRLCNDISEV